MLSKINTRFIPVPADATVLIIPAQVPNKPTKPSILLEPSMLDSFEKLGVPMVKGERWFRLKYAGFAQYALGWLEQAAKRHGVEMNVENFGGLDYKLNVNGAQQNINKFWREYSDIRRDCFVGR